MDRVDQNIVAYPEIAFTINKKITDRAKEKHIKLFDKMKIGQSSITDQN